MKNRGWQQFLTLCQTAKDEKDLSSILEVFLTHEEKENLSMRCLIVQALLAQKKTQREIAKELDVSIANITRGSNELKRLPTDLRNRLLKNLVLFYNRSKK